MAFCLKGDKIHDSEPSRSHLLCSVQEGRYIYVTAYQLITVWLSSYETCLPYGYRHAQIINTVTKGGVIQNCFMLPRQPLLDVSVDRIYKTGSTISIFNHEGICGQCYTDF